ncbi:ATP-binding protein [Paenibacillus sp. NPDC056579]|uniref:sensor histidine kinase n=1 Tax=Paenibacillus sp. NPDC056579 TaxID=3345871 RepID=UPI003691E02D
MNSRYELHPSSRLNRFPFTWFPFNIVRKLIILLRRLYFIGSGRIGRSIRLQLILTTCVCLLASTLTYAIGDEIFGEYQREAVIDYQVGLSRIDNEARGLMMDLKNRALDEKNTNIQHDEKMSDDFEQRVERIVQNDQYKVLITDLEGRVIFRSSNAPETNVEIHSIIDNAMNTRYEGNENRKVHSSFYPVNYNGQKSYLIVSGIPEPHITYQKNEGPLPFMGAAAVFIFLFYYLTQRKMRYVEELAGGLRIIATGNLSYRVIERSEDELGSLARDMNLMVEQLQQKIEEERRNERLKSELITNVSHDLRTPLTLIMGYLRLLHDKGYETQEQADSYVGIAYHKSEKLQSLIDDLFEYTKLSNHDVPMMKEGVAINELLDQLLEEFVTPAEEQQLTIQRHIPKEKILVKIDVDKMIRVFENLLTNAIKYSVKPGKITVMVKQDLRYVTIRFSNRSEMLEESEIKQLFDRFYRVDVSRSSNTGGSGLGLAIAKSIVESHDGAIWAEQSDEQIHFYVKIKLI